jgi:hypothetical protein
MSSENHHVDELLNGLIDEELTAAEEAEVRQRLGRDKGLVVRLEQLTACRTLVNSLPKAKVPADLAERVRQTLERRSLLGEAAPAGNERAFSSHLLARRVVAVAAAVVLVGMLSALVYSILSPSQTVRQPLAENGLAPHSGGPSRAGLQDTCALTGRLEVRVASLTDMEMFFNRALENNGLATTATRDDSTGRQVYRIQCSRAALESLLADLADVWNRFENPTFYLETGRMAGPVKVASVTPDQLARIARQGDAIQSTDAAREIAVQNAAARALSGEGALASMTSRGLDSRLDVAKPVLTSGEKPAHERPQAASGPKLVNFTLILDSR